MRRLGLLQLAAALVLLMGSIGNAQELLIQPLIGGFPADASFALGGEISRTHVAGPIGVRIKGLVSVKKYQLYQLGIEVPHVGRWLAFDLTGRYRNLPQDDFWGIGPNTPKNARTNYLLEDVDTTATLSTALGRFRAGVNGGFLRANTGPGRDKNFPSTPESLQAQPRLTHIGAYLEYQSLDEESDPHAGGKYSFEWTSYLSSFQRYAVDLRRFIPVSTTDRIGLRLQTLFTHSSNVKDVPFFMFPTVGGSDTARGFKHYRFRDRNALAMSFEYRRPVAEFLDVVAFADAGRVFSRSRDLGLRYLHPSAGAGLRVKFGGRVFFGIDVGLSSERAKLSFRSDNVF
jgi:hypothetical protein